MPDRTTHCFKVGRRYRNRKGEYEVIAIKPPRMVIRYSDGEVFEATLAIQERIWRNIQAELELGSEQTGIRLPKVRTSRANQIRETVTLLIERFDRWLKVFDDRPPFSKYGQLEYHQETINLRLSFNSAADAIHDDNFLRSLYYKTLPAWGIGKRGSRLLPYSEFSTALRLRMDEIANLDGMKIYDGQLDVASVSRSLWQLISSLEIVENKAKLVACSKALHHILPELVVPIDRKYTRNFFGWHQDKFQNKQEQFFNLAFENFVKVARATNPAQYVGVGWHTSSTKVIDNAIVGLLLWQGY